MIVPIRQFLISSQLGDRVHVYFPSNMICKTGEVDWTLPDYTTVRFSALRKPIRGVHVNTDIDVEFFQTEQLA